MAKKMAVPSLVGTTQDSAETTLTDAGLSVVKRYVSGEPDGTVYSQTPSSGKLAAGEVVTIDILRAPAAPAPVDLSGVTKSIGELNKAIAELKASAAELKTSVGELQTSAAELNASVGELKSSAATKDEVGTLGKSIQELRDAVGKAGDGSVQARRHGTGAGQGVVGRCQVGSTAARRPSHHRRQPQPTNLPRVANPDRACPADRPTVRGRRPPARAVGTPEGCAIRRARSRRSRGRSGGARPARRGRH